MTTKSPTQNDASANISSHSSLVNRLDLNQRYGHFDFHAWVFDRYDIRSGMDVLDVGCGNGAQALKAIRIVGSDGSISATDISADSVAELVRNAAVCPNVETRIGDMNELETMIREHFKVKSYDFAHATYSLAYASQPLKVLDAMRKALKPGGRLGVTTPNDPNSLRELSKRVGCPLPRLDQVGQFPKHVLEPYFRSYFYKVTVHMQRNIIRIPTLEEVLQFFRATAYFDPKIEACLSDFVTTEIRQYGHFRFEKNNYMILGEDQIAY